MGNIKVKVNNEAESKEVQELFFEMGFSWRGCGKNYLRMAFDFKFITAYCSDKHLGIGQGRYAEKELTIPELRDLVVLKRNDENDRTHTDSSDCDYYQDSCGNFYYKTLNAWLKTNELPDCIEKVEKNMSVLDTERYVEKEFLEKQEDSTYKLVLRGECGCADDIEVPSQHNFAFKRENGDVRFSKDSFNYYFGESIIWQRNPLIKSKDSKKEYLKKYDDGSYVLMDGAGYSGQEDWIEVPSGADVAASHKNGNVYFWKDNGLTNWVKKELDSLGRDNGWYECNSSKLTTLDEFIDEWVGDVEIIWQRATKPEELPFVDDESKEIDKCMRGLAQASKKLSDKVNVDRFKFKFMTEPPQSLNDTYAEIERVRQNSKLDQSISDFKNTDHGKEFDKFDLFVDEQQRENNHYFIDVSDVDEVDFYEIAKRYNVADPAIQHILKKCLAIGNRGHKDLETDLNDILKTAKRALVINGFNSKGESK